MTNANNHIDAVMENAEVKIKEIFGHMLAEIPPGPQRETCKEFDEAAPPAILRFASATFLVEGISRACSHQIVRHPHLSFLPVPATVLQGR